MTGLKITVVGIGYVGLSNAVLLAQKNTVIATDLDPNRVAQLNARQSPIEDEVLQQYLTENPLNLSATTETQAAYEGAEFIIIATPTNYEPKTNFFDTSSVEQVIKEIIAVNQHATIVIKSTVPVGFTTGISKQLGTTQVIFSPEFLREGNALFDNLHPSRIIVGEDCPSSDKLEHVSL